MSRTIKKALAAVVFAIVFLTGILCFAVINAAHAEGASPVKMLEGASVRYQMQEETDRSGIRFTAYVETEYKADNPEAVYGMLLIPSDLLGEGELTVGTASAVNKVVEVWTTSEEEGFDRFNVVLYNIPESEYGRVITARAYVKNGDVYTYSEESVSRSLGQVASLALADGDQNVEELNAYVDGAVVNFSVQESVSMEVGESVKASVKIEPQELAAVYESESDTVLSVADDGTITAVAEGVASVTVRLGSAEKTINVTVTKATEPLEAEITDYFVALGTFGTEDAAYYAQNAVRGGTVDGTKLMTVLSRVSARTTAEGSTSLEKLKNLGVITEEQIDVLSQTGVDGKTANEVLRSLYAYVKENNATLTDAELSTLVSVGAVEEGEKAAVAQQISTFGFIAPTKAEAIFIALATRIDETTSDRASALAVLKDINATQNTDGWNTQLNSAEVSGKDMMVALNITCSFIGGTLEDYEYLEEQNVITAEQANYFIRHGNNSNKAQGTEIVNLMISLAKPFDAEVADGTQAVATLKAQSVIGNDAAWLAIVNDADREVTVESLVNLVDKATDKIKALNAAELSAEVLDWFATPHTVKDSETTTRDCNIFSGSYNGEYFRKNAKLGGTLNQTETENMLVRAFRVVCNNWWVTIGNINKSINDVGFTFSEDAAENEAMKEYWTKCFNHEQSIEGEPLRILMTRIYDYMNGGISE